MSIVPPSDAPTDSTETRALTFPFFSASYRLSLEEMVAEWLTNLRSERTREKYCAAMEQFQALLALAGLTLDSPNESMIATLAEKWANHSKKGKQLSGSTINNRLASVSSFYEFARKKRWLNHNPMEMTTRQKETYPHAAMALSLEQAVAGLESIDCSTSMGLRDYVLLTVLLNTGRRLSEVTAMRCGDIEIASSTVTLVWPHCKGEKVMRDQVDEEVARVLLDYLKAVYPDGWRTDSPVWVSFSPQNQGQAIGTQTVAAVCKSHLGDSRVHITRHTFAVLLEGEGAKITDIGARLGHNNIATTHRYMVRLHSAENPFAHALAGRLRIRKRGA